MICFFKHCSFCFIGNVRESVFLCLPSAAQKKENAISCEVTEKNVYGWLFRFPLSIFICMVPTRICFLMDKLLSFFTKTLNSCFLKNSIWWITSKLQTTFTFTLHHSFIFHIPFLWDAKGSQQVILFKTPEKKLCPYLGWTNKYFSRVDQKRKLVGQGSELHKWLKIAKMGRECWASICGQTVDRQKKQWGKIRLCAVRKRVC